MAARSAKKSRARRRPRRLSRFAIVKLCEIAPQYFQILNTELAPKEFDYGIRDRSESFCSPSSPSH
jgi:hypothetical protein